MTEDHLGYIWLATDNGTIRYDGKQYTRYEVKTKRTNQATTA